MLAEAGIQMLKWSYLSLIVIFAVLLTPAALGVYGLLKFTDSLAKFAGSGRHGKRAELKT